MTDVVFAKAGRALRARPRLAAFLREKRGVAAVEFALIVPIMLALYVLTMEVSQAIETTKKVSRMASQVGDLVAQQANMTPTALRAIMEIGEVVLEPYHRSKPVITVTAIQVTDDTTPKAEVVWSRKLVNGQFTPAQQPGTTVEIPNTLMTPGAFLIRSEADLNYLPVITWSETAKNALGLMGAFDSIDMGERYYLRPRQTTDIRCDAC